MSVGVHLHLNYVTNDYFHIFTIIRYYFCNRVEIGSAVVTKSQSVPSIDY